MKRNSWVTADSNLVQAKAATASLQASRTALHDQTQNTREELTKLVNDGVEIERLSRQVDSDKEAYLSYTRKVEEARAAHALNRSKILNVSVAQPPSVPLRPISPNVPLNLAAGLLVALGLGLRAAYTQERNDPRIYSNRAISQATGLNVIGPVQKVS